MKKIFTLLALVAMLGLGSCKQNWTCQCVTDGSTVTNTPIRGGTFIHAHHECHSMGKGCSLLTDNR